MVMNFKDKVQVEKMLSKDLIEVGGESATSQI